MKRLISVLLGVVLLLGVGRAEIAGNLLGLDILKDMTDGTESAAVSPLSLFMALDMARQGAAGATLDELDQLLQGESVEQDVLSTSGLRMANAGFVAPEYPLNPEYKAGLSAEWFALGADGMSQVNDWVKEKTNGMIEEVLSKPPTDYTMMYLVNALAMDAGWLTEFDENNTREDVFHGKDGDQSVDFMNLQQYLLYAEREGTQIVRLPYVDSGLAMYVAMPTEGGETALLSALAKEGFGYFDGLTDTQEVQLSFPPFSLQTGGSLLEALQARGLEIVVTNAADFSRMGEEPLKIGDVIQKVRIDVDEAGTRAAAATVIEMVCGSAMIPEDIPEPVVMDVNRPFVIVIAEENTGAIAFAAYLATI